MAERLVIFDLDRTITRVATYTPFLVFTTLRLSPWRLLTIPGVIVAMLTYLAGGLDRSALKEWMLRLLLGRPKRNALTPRIEAFVDRLVSYGCFPQALAQIRASLNDGSVVMLATASFDFYVAEIAQRLGIPHVVATRSSWSDGDRLLSKIAGANCYGPDKLAMIEAYFEAQGWRRKKFHIQFFSDHHSDAPTFSWANEAIAVNPTPKLRAMTKTAGWRCVQWS